MNAIQFNKLLVSVVKGIDIHNFYIFVRQIYNYLFNNKLLFINYFRCRFVRNLKYKEIMEDNKQKNPTIREGWTLRDEFAKSAMQSLFQIEEIRKMLAEKAILINSEWENILAENAYSMADAMLKQREI